MQPVEAQKGVSTKSQLFNSLRVYLNNKNRLQPIIGLGSIIECVKTGTQNRELLYLCEVCVCRLSKADMRNHIMGSLHRYNYIKAWHPHLVSEWKEKSDLSKLAWPLMEMAKVLEGKEGPGEVQWLEVEDAVYQKIATHSENAAVTLITILKDWQGQDEPERRSDTTSLENYSIQSQRIVLLSQNQERLSRNSLKTSAETNQTVAFIKSEGRLKNTSPQPAVLSENGNSFLDGYTGTKPLIGLFRVVECRSEDGHTCCFLCHCCRIRSNKKDIIDHLTTSSHLLNYLMEIHPGKVEVMMAYNNDHYPLLHSMAKKVEQEEGRGELKVINAPESLCRLLTGKSYHWCIKMLCNGRAHTDIQKRKIAVKGPSVIKTSNEVMLGKCAALPSQRPKTMTAKRKMKKGTTTVFNVSLPITQGAMLLERISFSMNSLPESSAYPPSFGLDLTPLPESQSEGCELDYDTGPFESNHAEHTSQLKHDLYGGDADAGQHMEPERKVTVTPYKEVDAYFNDNEYFNQSEDLTVTKYQKVYRENNYTGQHGYQERSSQRFYYEYPNEGPQTQHEWKSPAVSYTQDLSSYNSYYGRETSSTAQWNNSTSPRNIGTRDLSKGHEMNSDVRQQYYYQQAQNQSMAQGPSGLQTGSAGQHGWSGGLAAHSEAAWINIHPCLGVPLAHRGSIASEPTVPLLQTEQRRYPTYMGVNHW
ncbi:uncharacterized protein si:ch211-199g17.2 [Anoplopoma fimbria]|uniref:uncharacterized protein si:ch211-199g17.2 n=1 Tax=Anoplopoma fimbria TaxID=229290 RepID=UPI0023EB6263|nr:uncharacterized protein si:ch211-199g17.2 [Anoplopoma fimbria]